MVRLDKLEAYEATREPVTERLVQRIPYMRPVCEVFGANAGRHARLSACRPSGLEIESQAYLNPAAPVGSVRRHVLGRDHAE